VAGFHLINELKMKLKIWIVATASTKPKKLGILRTSLNEPEIIALSMYKKPFFLILKENNWKHYKLPF
jgi:hypothetical protein